MASSGTSVPRRQLGRYLQQLRGESQISVQRVCAELTCSPQKLWRIEAGLVDVKVPDVKALCEIYQTTPEATRRLISLARQSVPTGGWWQTHDDAVPDWSEPHTMFESSADHIRHYDNQLVPALLQTDAYLIEVFTAGRPDLDSETRRRRIAQRRQRQKLLHRHGPIMTRLEFVLDEAILHRPIADPHAMDEQLRHLVHLNQQPGLNIRILPLTVGPHPASTTGTFTLLTFPEQRRRDSETPLVYQESATGGLYLDQPHDITHYQRVWRSLDTLALTTEESTKLIDSTRPC